jgi:hypothetical protein
LQLSPFGIVTEFTLSGNFALSLRDDMNNVPLTPTHLFLIHLAIAMFARSMNYSP